MSKLELAAMNCHHRFYPLEEFFASAASNGYKRLNSGQGHNISIWIMSVMIPSIN